MPGTCRSIAIAGCCALVGLLLEGCESDDDSAMAADAAAGSCPEYALENRSIVDGLSGEYRGSIADGDGDVSCAYDGSSFELALELDPDSDCAEAAFCPRNAFRCGLLGSVKIDDVVAGELEGAVGVTSGTGPGLSVNLSISAAADGGLMPDRIAELQGPRLSRKLGGVGGQLHWSWMRGSEDDPRWEACIATIEEVP